MVKKLGVKSTKKKSTKSHAAALDENTNNNHDEIMNILSALHENEIQKKKIMSELEKICDVSKTNTKNIIDICSFHNCEVVPQSLRLLLNIEQLSLPRSVVTNLFYEYLVREKLIDKKCQVIHYNQIIREIFKLDATYILDFYNLQTNINNVYSRELL